MMTTKEEWLSLTGDDWRAWLAKYPNDPRRSGRLILGVSSNWQAIKERLGLPADLAFDDWKKTNPEGVDPGEFY